MQKATAAMDRTGMPSERVVRVIRHALTANRPKTRYPVGFRTRLAAWAASRIPDGIHDWYMSAIGTRRGRAAHRKRLKSIH